MNVQAMLDELLAGARKVGADLMPQSAALGKAAVTAGEIGYRAAQDLLAGRIDAAGAQAVAERGFDQFVTLAHAQGNLTAAVTASWAKQLFGTVLRLIAPLVPKP